MDKKKFCFFRDNWFCELCIKKNDIIRYNPFLDVIENHDTENSHEYDDDDDVIETSLRISEILENCKTYEIAEFLDMTSELKINKNNQFSTLFQNIDGKPVDQRLLDGETL